MQVKTADFDFGVRILSRAPLDSQDRQDWGEVAATGKLNPEDFLSPGRVELKGSVTRAGGSLASAEMHMNVKVRMEQADLPAGLLALPNITGQSGVTTGAPIHCRGCGGSLTVLRLGDHLLDKPALALDPVVWNAQRDVYGAGIRTRGAFLTGWSKLPRSPGTSGSSNECWRPLSPRVRPPDHCSLPALEVQEFYRFRPWWNFEP